MTLASVPSTATLACRRRRRPRAGAPLPAGGPRAGVRLEEEQGEERRPLGHLQRVDALVRRMRALTDRAETVQRAGEEARRVGVRAAADEARVLEREAELVPEPHRGREERAVPRECLHRRPAPASLDLDRGPLEDRASAP